MENLLTKLWHSLACNKALVSNFWEFAKLVEIAIAQVLGLVNLMNLPFLPFPS